MVEPLRHRRTKGAETDMFEPKATASHLDSTHFGHGAMSDLSPLCAPERSFTNATRLIASHLTNPHCRAVLLRHGCGKITRRANFPFSPSGKSLLGLTPSCP